VDQVSGNETRRVISLGRARQTWAAWIRCSRARWSSLAVYFGLAALVWLATHEAGTSLELFERGTWLGPASDMLAGKVPYRQTFPLHGFLSDGGLDFILFRVFGVAFDVSVTAHDLLKSLFQPTLFLVGAAATRRPGLAALAIPMNIGFATGISFDRPVIALLSLVAFLLAIDTERRRPLAFLAGLLGALGILYSLEFGSFVLLAELATLCVSWLADPRRQDVCLPAWPFLAGVAVVLVPFCILLGALGAILPFLRVSFLDLPRHIDSVWGMHFPPPWEVVGAWIRRKELFVGELRVGPGLAKRLYLDPLLGAAGIMLSWLVWRRTVCRPLALRIIALSLACGLFFRYAIARLHLEYGNALTGPLFLLILVSAYDAFPASGADRRGRIRPAVFAATAILAALMMNAPIRTWRVLRSAAEYKTRMSRQAGLVALSVPRGGGVRVPEEEARNLGEIIRFVNQQTPPDSRILDLSNEPALYFFLKRQNPTRFYQVPMMAPFQEEVLRDIKNSPPAAIVLESGGGLDAMDDVPNSTRIPRVWSYVTSAYPRQFRVGTATIALAGTSPSTSAGPPPKDACGEASLTR
jgi:hypothetical protein